MRDNVPQKNINIMEPQPPTQRKPTKKDFANDYLASLEGTEFENQSKYEYFGWNNWIANWTDNQKYSGPMHVIELWMEPKKESLYPFQHPTPDENQTYVSNHDWFAAIGGENNHTDEAKSAMLSCFRVAGSLVSRNNAEHRVLSMLMQLGMMIPAARAISRLWKNP